MISTRTEHLLEESRGPTDETSVLRARVTELERERDHLVAVVDILTEISASLHFTDILRTIARKLGETFGLDRCSIYLAGDAQSVRLVATLRRPLHRQPDRRPRPVSGAQARVPERRDGVHSRRRHAPDVSGRRS